MVRNILLKDVIGFANLGKAFAEKLAFSLGGGTRGIEYYEKQP